MATETDDIDLLRAFALARDERAFARLVARHGGWIAAAARRRLRDDQLAEDAVQAVFVVLAEKASALVEGAATRRSLSAWLFHVTHFTCARLGRARGRRVKHERLAALRRADNDVDAAGDVTAFAELEEHVARLPQADREAIVRRFYRRQSFAEIGAALGASADAARKRVGRAVAMLREWMDDDAGDALGRDLVRPRGRTSTRDRVRRIQRETSTMAASSETVDPRSSAGGFQMVSAEFVVSDVEANLAFFETLGFPRRFVDTPDADGRIPRASLTAGRLGKAWLRRPVGDEQVRASPGVKMFFWIEGGPDGLIAFRRRLGDAGISVTPIVDEHRLPNFDVETPDGHAIAFFTAYVAPGTPPVAFVE